MSRFALVLVLLTAAVESFAAKHAAPALSEDELLSGAALFGEPVAEKTIDADAVLALDDEMRAFVRAQTGRTSSPDVKLRRLLSAMRDIGLFALDYTGTTTRTVRETFHERRGNCLSSTMLFVALAREAGLRVSYQMVDIPPFWSTDSGVIMLNNHVNALIKGAFQQDYVVDFNVADFKGNYESREVTDGYALALYHSNLGAESLIDEEHEQSFAELRAAITAYPDIPGPWVNLGVLYSRRELVDHAEAAYLHALEADRGNRSALTNLMSLYESRGDDERAEVYRKEVRAYQQRNPYYHYFLAQQAYTEQRFADTLESIDTALRLKRDEHQFHFLQGLAYYGLGRKEDAERSFVEARDSAQFAEIRSRYDSKIQALL